MAALTTLRARTGAPEASGRPRRDVLAFYGLRGVLAFWISFGPAAGL